VSRFIVTVDYTEQRVRPTSIVKARKMAKKLYRDAHPDVAPYVELFFHRRRDGIEVLAVDNGYDTAYATGITVQREK
jgi:hypothetical protein